MWRGRAPVLTVALLLCVVRADSYDEAIALYKELGGYPYDRDPGRPEWYALVPNERWADPQDDSRPNMSNRSS